MEGRTGPYPPDFLILGAQKCGTTSLVNSLQSHPEIFIPRAKEAHHFGSVEDDEAGGPRYWKFFSGWDGQPIVGEATPSYIARSSSAAQICRVLPQVKGIAMLRNPVDRAYSAYWHRVRNGREQRSFTKMIAAELGTTSATCDDELSVLARGRYVEQLLRYLDFGFERDRLLVLIFEEVKSNASLALRSIQVFLGVEVLPLELPRSNHVRRNVLPLPIRRALEKRWANPMVRRILRASDRPFTPPPMDPAVRARLVEYYRPHNARLAQLLGRDLPDWDR